MMPVSKHVRAMRGTAPPHAQLKWSWLRNLRFVYCPSRAFEPGRAVRLVSLYARTWIIIKAVKGPHHMSIIPRGKRVMRSRVCVKGVAVKRIKKTYELV